MAYWAHIGGFVFGLAAAGAIKTTRIEERYIHPALEGKIHSTVISNESVDRALQLQQDGHLDQAFQLLAQETRRSPSNLDAGLAFWSVAVDSNRAAQAAPGAALAQRDLDPDTRTRAEQLAARLGPATSNPAPSTVNSVQPLKLS